MEEQKQRRKTHTSTEVKARYNAKTYQRYALTLRNADDAELIAAIEAKRAPGESDSSVMKSILYEWHNGRG